MLCNLKVVQIKKKKKNVVRYTILTYRKDNLYNMNHKYAFLEDNKELETIYRATYYDYIFFPRSIKNNENK